MQVAPTTTPVDDWAADAIVDRCSREAIALKVLDPGEYSVEEEAQIQRGLRIVNRLGGDNDSVDNKQTDIVMEKYETHTPLKSAFICHDMTNGVTYGKVSSTVRGASLLDLVSFLVDYTSHFETKYKEAHNRIKFGILERVNNHHLVFYYETSAPPPLCNRDFVWSFVTKQINKNQFVCVYQPTLHDDAPSSPPRRSFEESNQESSVSRGSHQL